MAWLTVIAATIIAGPMGLWLAGIGPTVMLVVNVSALILTVRLFSIAAGFAGSRRNLFTLGLFSGLLGSLLGELLLHIGGTADLATAFAAYASLGSTLYRLDVFSRWWPFLFVAVSALFYAGLAMLVNHLVQYRRQLLGIEASSHATTHRR